MTQREFHAACMKLLQRVACDRRLSGTEARLTVLLLTKYANHKYGCAWPSRERLADELGVNPGTVTRSIERLESRGYFAVQRNKGRGHTNRYVPLFDDEEKGAPLHPYKGGGNEEKGANQYEKGRKPRTEKGAALHQEPSNEPSNEPANSFAVLASPLESGERRSPPMGLQCEGGANSKAAPRPEPSRRNDGLTACKQESDADIGENQEPPSVRRRVFSEMLNQNRAPMRAPSYWKERAESDRAEKMTPEERERDWLRRKFDKGFRQKMGGFGSGGWNSTGRATAGEALRLDVNRLNKTGWVASRGLV